jgi:hypothetical protein
MGQETMRILETLLSRTSICDKFGVKWWKNQSEILKFVGKFDFEWFHNYLIGLKEPICNVAKLNLTWKVEI